MVYERDPHYEEEKKINNLILENKKKFVKQIITLDSLATFLSGIFLTDLLTQGAINIISFILLVISWCCFLLSIIYADRAYEEAMLEMRTGFHGERDKVYYHYRNSVSWFLKGIIIFIVFSISVYIASLFS